MGLIKTSNYLSSIMRHKPEIIDVQLDEYGWADVEKIVSGIRKTHELNIELLEKIVETDEKHRYSFNFDKTLIKANYGHSVPINIEPLLAVPPKDLYHGTADKYMESIDSQGIFAKSRNYVHLSSNIENAINVGRRHGNPVVYKIATEDMQADGYKFYKAESGVWLTKEVPLKYITKLTY